MDDNKRFLVIYHGGCPDGFGAAMAVHRVLGDAAEYFPAVYGKPYPDVKGRSVYILDFSFHEDDMRDILAKANRVTWIDHHASAKPLADKLMAERHKNLDCTMNLDRSGASLTWERMHGTTGIPQVVKHIEDLDLWRWHLDGTREVCFYLDSIKMDFDAWESAFKLDIKDMIAIGSHIGNYYDAKLESAIKSAYEVCIDGVNGLALNANGMFASEAGNILATRAGTFAMIWSEGSDGFIKGSFRGTPEFNVIPLAELFGGGGHPGAAGFRATREMMDVMVRRAQPDARTGVR